MFGGDIYISGKKARKSRQKTLKQKEKEELLEQKKQELLEQKRRIEREEKARTRIFSSLEKRRRKCSKYSEEEIQDRISRRLVKTFPWGFSFLFLAYIPLYIIICAIVLSISNTILEISVITRLLLHLGILIGCVYVSFFYGNFLYFLYGLRRGTPLLITCIVLNVVLLISHISSLIIFFNNVSLEIYISIALLPCSFYSLLIGIFREYKNWTCTYCGVAHAIQCVEIKSGSEVRTERTVTSGGIHTENVKINGEDYEFKYHTSPEVVEHQYTEFWGTKIHYCFACERRRRSHYHSKI